MTGIPQRTRNHAANPDSPNTAPSAAVGIDIVLIPPQKRDH
ncbi:hypothetical protein [Nocardia thailandica]|nr:hypothetical protein [Nocardia thailandica]